MLAPFDLIVLFLFAGATITAVRGEDHSVTAAFSAVATIGLMHVGVSWAKMRSDRFGRWIDGTPVVVFEGGRWHEPADPVSARSPRSAMPWSSAAAASRSSSRPNRSDAANMSKPVVLQVAAMLPHIQRVLDESYEMVRLPRDAAEHPPFLAAHAARIVGAVTGAQQGIPPDLVDHLAALQIVAISGVGFDAVNLDQARARGIRVTNTPDVLNDDVADLAIAMMLNVYRRLPEADRFVRAGEWARASMKLARRASGLRYGIVGLGRIGHAIARRVAGFGGTIAYTGPNRKDVAHTFHAGLVDLAAASDVLFLALPASSNTRRVIDRAVLDALGPDGVLVNIARGAVVDEDALVAALVEGRLGGAGLDVFEREPHVPEALWTLPNVVLAPHVGSATDETRSAMGQLMLDNLAAHFAGGPLPTPVV